MKYNGIIAINKPINWTSFDVVNKLKYMLKPNKVGHLGTLDPMATGVLLVTVGSATKLFDLMQQKTKTYVATFEFGYQTDTLDATGEITNKNNKMPNRQQIENILPKFIGKISQIPPKYSAKSINGVRAYDLARKGVEFELKPKQIEIFSINIIDLIENKLTLEIVCGSGTYIRAIGRDIASELNTFATMTSLVRTKIDNFSLNSCQEINAISSENIADFIISINSVLNLPTLNLSETLTNKLLNGQIIEITENSGLFKLNWQNNTVALVEIKENKAKMSVFLG